MKTTRQKIIDVLEASHLVISMTRRMGANGLKNADEIADKIIEELEKDE